MRDHPPAQRVHSIGVAVEQRLQRATVTTRRPGGEVGVVVTQTAPRGRCRRGCRGTAGSTACSRPGCACSTGRRGRRGTRRRRLRSRAGTRARPTPRSRHSCAAVPVAAPSADAVSGAAWAGVGGSRTRSRALRVGAQPPPARPALHPPTRIDARDRAPCTCARCRRAPGGTSGRCGRIGGAVVVSRAIAVATSVSPPNGGRPQSIS